MPFPNILYIFTYFLWGGGISRPRHGFDLGGRSQVEYSFRAGTSATFFRNATDQGRIVAAANRDSHDKIKN